MRAGTFAPIGVSELNIWFMLWVFFSVFVLGIFFWTILILLRQKTAWQEFAKRNSLFFTRKGVLDSAVVNGLYKGFPVTVFSESQSDDSARGRRFRTIVQFDLPPGMPTEGVAASPALELFVKNLPLAEYYVPTGEWDKRSLVKTMNPKALGEYFTPDRVRVLNGLMSVSGLNTLFVFNERETLLRVESPDPMSDSAKLDRLVSKVADVVRVMSLPTA